MNQITYLTAAEIAQICNSKTKEISELIVKWERKFSFSKILRTVLLCICILAPIITGLNSWRIKEKWIVIFINSFLSLVVVSAASGILMLILKPIFYILMRKAKKIHQRITESEKELYSLEFMMLDTDRPKDFCYEAYWRYQEILPKIYEINSRIRETKMEKIRYGEWAWVARGVFFIGICLAIVLVYIAIALLFISILFFMLHIWFASRGDVPYYIYDKKYDYEYENGKDEDSLIAKIFFYAFRSTSGLNKILKNHMQDLDKYILERNEIISEFVHSGTPETSITFYH